MAYLPYVERVQFRGSRMRDLPPSIRRLFHSRTIRRGVKNVLKRGGKADVDLEWQGPYLVGVHIRPIPPRADQMDLLEEVA